MQKAIYILKGIQGESYPEFTARMLRISGKLKDDFRPETLKITLTTRKQPRWSVIPFKKEKTAAISVTGSREGLRQDLAQVEGFIGGYEVAEAVPVAYEKSWPDGNPSPGVCLLTLFHQKPGLERDLFISRWHEGHTPLSLRLHPLWNYNRNVVEKRVEQTSPWYDGIVEEQFRSEKELLNPIMFFGPPLKVPLHMVAVYKDSRSFIDMKRIETYLATEYHIKS